MENQPVVITAFAANTDMPHVFVEANSIKETLSAQDQVKSVHIEDVDITQLVNKVLDHHRNLYFFHFSGHAAPNKLVLDEFRELDGIRLSRLLLPREQHQKLQWVFFNGCFSYGHVGVLTAKGVKAVIATNLAVLDKNAANLSSIFYKCFFNQDFTLKEAFEYAETIITGNVSSPIIVNPGEIPSAPPATSAWTLYVNTKFKEVIDWTLEDFLTKGLEVTEEARKTEPTAENINKAKVKGKNNQVFQGISGSEINANTGAAQKVDKI